MTKHNFPVFVLYTSLNLIIFGWINASNIFASFSVTFLSFSYIDLKSIYLITHKLLSCKDLTKKATPNDPYPNFFILL